MPINPQLLIKQRKQAREFAHKMGEIATFKAAEAKLKQVYYDVHVRHTGHKSLSNVTMDEFLSQIHPRVQRMYELRPIT